MLRPLSTYLLFVVTCSFFLMGMHGLYLDNFVKSTDADYTQVSIHTQHNHSFVDTAEHSLPIEHSNMLIENFDLENEVEVELDVLPSIEIVPYYYHVKNLSGLFLNVYSAYSFTVIKIEFLDIFSPPPNC